MPINFLLLVARSNAFVEPRHILLIKAVIARNALVDVELPAF